MATVREIAPGRWELRVYLGKDPLTGKPVQPSKTVDAAGKRDAQRQATDWEVELRGEPTKRRSDTFGTLLDEWFALKAQRWSPGTLKEHRGIRRRYFKALEPIDVAKITARTLDVFYAELEARGGRCQHRPCRIACPKHGRYCRRVTCKRPPCAQHRGGRCTAWVPCDDQPCPHGAPLDPGTVRRVHVVVHAVLQQAMKWDEWGLRRNPADYVTLTEVDEDEIEPPEHVEIVAILAEAQEVDERLAVFLQLAIDTGARRGAVCALRWSHLEVVAGMASFPNVIVVADGGVVERKATRKKRSGQRVALNPYTVAGLKGLRKRAEERARAADAVLPHDAYVFSDDTLGQVPWRPDSTSRKFRHLRHRVDLDDTRLHDLRHFMATVLLAAGVAPQVVARRGGWRQVATMLDRYAHVLEASDRDAAQAIGALLAPA